MDTLTSRLKAAAKALAGDEGNIPFIPRPTRALPDVETTREMMELAKTLLFPGFFDDKGQDAEARVKRFHFLLDEQVRACTRFSDETPGDSSTAIAFIERMPEIRRVLSTDVRAVREGDPAATSVAEVICCYPAIRAMTHYRVARELLLLGVPLLPRVITELAHSDTGIDIHPGARVGEYFSIDHGTGVVIGETCIIGNRVRLYQGVTLGAKSFTLDSEGLPANVPRHPVIEDNVIIYSNSTILGRVTIGHDSIIGGNIWQTRDVPPHSRVVQRRATRGFTDGLGI
ncbi:MAG: serine acetyltransferase [Odoribacteraceae bacterium]|jgi:serine O-acetyltransferase|nr:serine acetyltransferase [Odoribacteraceae bacterium]